MIVYCITNKVNGKKYIGMTGRTLNQRWNSHCSSAKNGSPFRFHSAIRKYGEESFDLEILYNNLEINSCRTIEEETIAEYETIKFGYNAKPGGCGGWIVSDEKYDEWLVKLCRSLSLNGNPKWSGYSDEFILEECKKLFKSYSDKKQFSFKGILDDLRKIYPNIPKSFSKNRFKNYGGFKKGLSDTLGYTLEELTKLSYAKTKTHKNSLKNAISGFHWYSNDEIKQSKQSKDHPGDGWYKGRKYGAIN